MSTLKCIKCNESNGTLRRCVACLSVSYCSKKCQSDHWKSIHKQECKMKQVDKILNALSENEKIGFMDCSAFDQEFMRHYDNFTLGIAPKRLPDVMCFINPIRYMTSMMDLGRESVKEMMRQARANNYDSTPFQQLDLKVTHIATCPQTFGIIKYLAMCSKLNKCMMFYEESSEGRIAVEKVFNLFVNKSSCKFDVLLAFMGLSQYELRGDRAHYFAVMRMNDKYRLIQSFGRKFTLKQMLNAKYWMNKDEIIKILDGFLQLEKVWLDQELTETDLALIKEKSNLCLGFELKIDPNAPKRREDQLMRAVTLKDLSFKHFKAASQHLLDFMDYYLDKIEKRELGSMNYDADLRYRMAYPDCLNQELLRSAAREWPERYSNYL